MFTVDSSCASPESSTSPAVMVPLPALLLAALARIGAAAAIRAGSVIATENPAMASRDG